MREPPVQVEVCCSMSECSGQRRLEARCSSTQWSLSWDRGDEGKAYWKYEEESMNARMYGDVSAFV